MNRIALKLAYIQIANQVELLALLGVREQAILHVFQRGARLLIDSQRGCIEPRYLIRADLCALEDRRQECATIIPRTAVISRWINRDEAGQIRILGAQAIQGPSADRWPRKLE